MGERKLTITQAAELLRCSKDTIRRRIKMGEIAAKKEEGPYGEQYYIPEKQFSKATITQEVVPLTRQVSIGDFQAAMKTVLAESIEEATEELREHIKTLEAKLDQQTELLKAIGEQRVPQDKRSLWQRIFGGGGEG